MKNIFMNTEMTKAILDSQKTQTRRVVKGGFLDKNEAKIISNLFKENKYDEALSLWGFEAKYQKDEVIWVREPVRVWAFISNDLDFSYNADGVNMTKKLPNRFYDENNNTPKWTDGHEDGRYIPNGCIKEMARIFLKITDVRVERLQDIKYGSIMNEGCNIDISDCVKYDGENQEEAINHSVYNWWIRLWNKTALKGYNWKDNPYVFVYEFKRVNKDGSEFIKIGENND